MLWARFLKATMYGQNGGRSGRQLKKKPEDMVSHKRKEKNPEKLRSQINQAECSAREQFGITFNEVAFVLTLKRIA